MSSDVVSPRSPGRFGFVLTGAGAGALAGGVVGGLAARAELSAAWAEVAAEGWLDQGLRRLAWLRLDAGVALLVQAVLVGAAAGLLLSLLLVALGRGPARGWRGGAAVLLRSVGLLVVAAAFALAAVRATTLGQRADGPHVVWIVIDALRADHLGCYGYEKPTSPFLDSLAADSTRFEWALAQESYTMASAASYFTSLYPPETKVLYDKPDIDTLAPGFVTVAEVLKDAGYDTGAFVFNPHLFAKYRFDQGFDVYDDGFPRLGDGFITEDSLVWEGYETVRPMRRKVEAFLGDPAVANSGRPKFMYLHYRDVHGPYVPPPGYSSLFVPDDWSDEMRAWAEEWIHRPISREKEPPAPPLPPEALARGDHIDWTTKPAGLPFVLSQYDGTIRYTDDGVKELFELLARHGIERDDTIVVITADHGEEFLDDHPGDEFPLCGNHGRTLYVEQVRVPLIVSVPGDEDRGRVVDLPVELVDVGPTILDAAGLGERVPASFRGRSLLPLVRGKPLSERPVYAGGNHGRGLVLSKGLAYYHYERQTKERRRYYAERPPAEYEYQTGQELYELGQDPQQTVELLSSADGDGSGRRDAARSLNQLLMDWIARGVDVAGGGTMDYEESEREHLKALGYLGEDEPPAPPRPQDPPPDAPPAAGEKTGAASPSADGIEVPVAALQPPACTCGLPARLAVAGSGRREGDSYWICSKQGAPDACAFFVWVE